AAICPPGSRVDVCVRQLGQVRKEAATTDCGGSPGSFFTHRETPPLAGFHAAETRHFLCAAVEQIAFLLTIPPPAPSLAGDGRFTRHVRRQPALERRGRGRGRTDFGGNGSCRAGVDVR